MCSSGEILLSLCLSIRLLAGAGICISIEQVLTLDIIWLVMTEGVMDISFVWGDGLSVVNWLCSTSP